MIIECIFGSQRQRGAEKMLMFGTLLSVSFCGNCITSYCATRYRCICAEVCHRKSLIIPLFLSGTLTLSLFLRNSKSTREKERDNERFSVMLIQTFMDSVTTYYLRPTARLFEVLLNLGVSELRYKIVWWYVAKWIGVRRMWFNSQCWPCVEVTGKLHISHCLGPTSCTRCLVHRSKVGSIVAGCIGAHLARGS